MSNELERLWDQVEHDLGFRDHNMRRDRPYNGQLHTNTGARGATEIKGITFRDLRDCFIRAVLLSTGAEVIDGVNMRPRYEEANKGENAALCENDLYGFNLNRLDPMAICQNLSCEIERAMGIYPNVSELRASGVTAAPAPLSDEAAYKHDRAYTDGMVYARQCIGAPTTMERADEALRKLDAVIQRRHEQERNHRVERRASGVGLPDGAKR